MSFSPSRKFLAVWTYGPINSLNRPRTSYITITQDPLIPRERTRPFSSGNDRRVGKSKSRRVGEWSPFGSEVWWTENRVGLDHTPVMGRRGCKCFIDTGFTLLRLPFVSTITVSLYLIRILGTHLLLQSAYRQHFTVHCVDIGCDRT